MNQFNITKNHLSMIEYINTICMAISGEGVTVQWCKGEIQCRCKTLDILDKISIEAQNFLKSKGWNFFDANSSIIFYCIE